MTLDFQRDLCDRLDECGIEYVLVTVHKDHTNKKNPEFVITKFESLSEEGKEAALIGLKQQIKSLEKTIK